MNSLYTELGGEVSIEQIVDILYRRILEDPALAFFFEHADVSRVKRKFREFIHVVTGGPHKHSGLELRGAHAGAVEQGLSFEHFTAFLNHFDAALREANVRPELTTRILETVTLCRKDVLGL
ncbi:MAG: group 1 truncated hemoglobin [Candidatus Hydrogenedentes bacterium]|nr:group 1 truncated hemoglobin [Candidatus Hydrogenedentota bacterium]